MKLTKITDNSYYYYLEAGKLFQKMKDGLYENKI